MVNTHYIEEVFHLRISRTWCFAALTLVLQFFSVASRNFLLLEVREITSLILSLPSKLMQFQNSKYCPADAVNPPAGLSVKAFGFGKPKNQSNKRKPKNFLEPPLRKLKRPHSSPYLR